MIETTMANIRNLSDGVPWVALYPSREELEFKGSSSTNSYRVIHQHSFEKDDENYPALEEGEVLVWHDTYGLVIFQSIDLDFT